MRTDLTVPELAYLAGVVEARGNINFILDKSRPGRISPESYPVLEIKLKDKELMHNLQALLQCGTVSPQKTKYSTTWKFQVKHQKCIQVLLAVKPYLSSTSFKQQVAVLKEFQSWKLPLMRGSHLKQKKNRNYLERGIERFREKLREAKKIGNGGKLK